MATLDAKQIANGLTLKVRIKRSGEWWFRIKVGMLLIRLAAWVMWMPIEFEFEEPR
jgi:hypothetical protein